MNIPKINGAYLKVASIPSRRNVSFQALQSRLIRFVNLRIKNGDFTERGLARILGISQSQIHNVLKGARRLQPELADHLMAKLDVSLVDLLELGELNDQASLLHANPVSELADVRKIGPTPARKYQSKLPHLKAG
ncbi:MAG: helix-turn-helix domain-containing protein [Bryobacteraceae bacterium]